MGRFSNTREKRAVLNIFVSLCYQLVSIVCGIVIPQLMIKSFGSELYGATTSILNFLSYITLLEGGIGGVARAALYKPLADNDTEKISAVVQELKSFFRIIGYIFVVYSLIIAASFSKISHIEILNWKESFFLVLIISISTCAEYFFGVSYSVLIQSDQKTYVTDFIAIITTILNTVFVVLLVAFGSSIFVVKFVGSCVFALRPILLCLYVKHKYNLSTKESATNKDLLKDKWVGLSQHIAYFLYSNTDIVVLTVFANLKAVSVYSVYSLVITSIQSIALSSGSGMEAVFGEMIAKKEIKDLNDSFTNYETLLSIVVITLLSITYVMILPFISLYTKGVTDVNYQQPLFATLLICVSLVTCLRTPYHNVVIAAGAFRETQVAAYGEAILNIVLSILFVSKWGLVGVAIGTLVAVAFRFIFYVFFLAKNIINRSIGTFLRRQIINVSGFVLVIFLGEKISSNFIFANYLQWILCAVLVSVMAFTIVVLLNLIFYRDFFKRFVRGKRDL